MMARDKNFRRREMKAGKRKALTKPAIQVHHGCAGTNIDPKRVARCPGCGGLVQMPCRECAGRAIRAQAKLDCEAARAAV